MADELEFSQIVVEAGWGCFLWAVETSGNDTLVGIDFDVLEKDISEDLMNRFARWHEIWDEAHQHVIDGSPAPEDFSEDEFHAEGRSLAQELATVVGHPVEYRPWASKDSRLDFSGKPTVALLDLPTRQHMTEEEVVQKANEAATRHGWNLDRYGHPQLFRWHPDEWQLFYEGSGQPGDWFLVIVNWRTGAVKVHGGY